MSIKLRTASDGLVVLQPEDTASEVTVTVPAGTSDLVSTDTLRTELNATGSAPIYACRAWCNFNGTGTVSIRESGNVSSITDNGTGDYTVNFTTAMPDADYSVSYSAGEGDTRNRFISPGFRATPSTSSFRFLTVNSVFNLTDSTYITVQVIR